MITTKYNEREGALEILELEDNRFVMQLKPEYTRRVRRLAIRPILKDGALKTLSYVAYRQPISQKQVTKVRGPHAYNHLKQMEEMGMVTRQQEGRTKIVQTTEFFSDYFGLSGDLKIMKRQLKEKFDEFLKLKNH
jgi:segregation and condensation protein B